MDFVENNLIFIDGNLADYQTLVEGNSNNDNNHEIILLDSTRNGIEQITEVLAKQNESTIDSIQLISHGDRGELQLGNTTLTTENLVSSRDNLITWQRALTEEADILIYGCNVAQDAVGWNFVQKLSQITQADVAASNNLTGNALLGGDWELEVATGKIEAQLALDEATRNAYQSVLVSYNGKEYVLTNGVKSWEQAQAEAISLGGNLVTINNAAEETWLKQTFGQTEGFWIGLNDRRIEGQFEWVNGEPITYTNWASGEPNNGGGNQDFGWMNYSSTRQWDDVGAANFRGIIEINSTTPPTLGANIVTNNSFENNAIAANNWGLVSNLPGWSPTIQSVIEVQKLSNLFGSADDGAAWVELDSVGNGGIIQNLPTTTGKDYQLSFAYSPRPNVASSSNGIALYWGGQLIDTISRTGGSSNSWQTYTYNVKANSATTSLEFRAVGSSNGVGGFLDDVKVQPIETNNNQPGVIGLSSNTYRIDEPDGTAQVIIQRTQGSSGVVTVDYRSVDASATTGQDYNSVSGTVTFADGETSKTISIPILDDSLIEGTEEFSFTIDNVTGGATLLAPRTALVRILDNEADLEPAFNFDNFANASQLAFNGNAALTGNTLRLTPATNNQVGSTFFVRPLAIDADTSFSNQFQFQIAGGQGSSGADGLTFMLQNSNNGLNALGFRGGDLGYGNTQNTSIPNINQSLAVEFDTYNNGTGWDINSNHVSILRDGNVRNALTTANSPLDLNGGSVITTWIDYNGETNLLEVFLANNNIKPQTAFLSLNIDLVSVVGSQAFFGFSAGTGGLANNHDIQSWKLTTNSNLLPAPPRPLSLTKQTVISGLNQPAAIEWTPNGETMFVAEKGGVIKVFQNSQLLNTPFIDLSAQVNGTRDRGLLDIAVHPDFFNGSPYVYALYTYDPPQVFQNTGLAGADGIGNRAGRLTRITADASTNFTTAVPGSEVVILGTNSTWENFNAFANSTSNFNEPPAGILPDGSNLQDFLAADSESHTIGAVEFGRDGALYVSNGDGTSYNQVDPRTVRVEDINNLSGKILRIDPITGDGLPDNPFYNGDPDANRSKVYQYGLRNPFRITIDPRNGKLYVGDVGWTQWEEINSAAAGANFGWPYYEGGSGNNLQTGGYRDLAQARDFYSSGQVATPSIYALNHGTTGINAIVLGDIYTGNNFPQEYQGDLFFNDLGQGIVRNISFDASGNITSVDTFTTGANAVVQIIEGPDGKLYYVDLDDGLVGSWQFV